MSEIILFHHVLGLTDGVHGFADELRRHGHGVHTPDLFEGRTFATIPEGLEYAQQTGDEELFARARAAVADLPQRAVLGGFSWGVQPAEELLLESPEAAGALLFHGFVDPSFLRGTWRTDVPVHVFGMDQDPFLTEEGGDLESAREVADRDGTVHVHLYPGTGHLFTDATSPDHDAAATARVLADTLVALSEMGADPA